jgi:serine/threonine-protein kinase
MWPTARSVSGAFLDLATWDAHTSSEGRVLTEDGSVQAGEVIAGKFQVERVLGEGGMGYVVAARHLQLGQMVALKFIKEDVSSPEFKARFLREARNTVKLKSKHVSRVLDVGQIDGGSPYMVMEYLEGTDLSELLQKRGPFPVAETAEYVIQACEAIAEAHQHGIVHRDLKPANLFLTRGTGGEAVVKVLDFGVSKVVDLNEDTSGREDSVMTKATDLLGSPSYMAPEQVVSARDADAKSDVWSLGVILFRLISGKAPFAGNSLGDLIQKIVHGPLPNLRELRPDIPEGFEHVIWRCFERERANRPDAIELARMLAPYAGPNASPSLERIAILGPALVRPSPVSGSIHPPALPVIPPIPNSRGSFSGPKGWSAPPLPVPHSPKKDMSAASFVVWALLLIGVVGSLVFVASRLKKMPSLGGGDKPAPSFAPIVQPVDTTSTVATTTTAATNVPPPAPAPLPAPTAVTPSAKPSASHATAPTNTHKSNTGPGPRPPSPAPAPAPAPPTTSTSEIPNSREY